MKRAICWLAVMLLFAVVVVAGDSTKVEIKAKQEVPEQVKQVIGDSTKAEIKAKQEVPEQVKQVIGDSTKAEIKIKHEIPEQLKKTIGDSTKAEGKANPEAPGQVKKGTDQKAAEGIKAGAQKGTENKMQTTATGLKIIDKVVGTGEEAVKGDQVEVHYTGWLWDNGKKGTKFDSSVDRGKPFAFKLGAGQVIKGWDEGVAGMKIGGTRELIIPPALAYGQRAVGGVIPANSTLMFEVELLKVTKGN